VVRRRFLSLRLQGLVLCSSPKANNGHASKMGKTRFG
jgi:hypothetical protein